MGAVGAGPGAATLTPRGPQIPRTRGPMLRPSAPSAPDPAGRADPATEPRRRLPRGPAHLPRSYPLRSGAGFKVDAEWEFARASLRASALKPLNLRSRPANF